LIQLQVVAAILIQSKECAGVQEIEAQARNDHVELPTGAKPIVALSDLIWKAYDADAPEVRVGLQEGGLTKLALVRIEALKKADPV
jgi:hypothetical protein